ncbi:MAG TPA: OprO/OprP family phosphate-selective porin [Arenimonas sp.]|uniref:OprO/OprP family phosphate-selective porin n=1 Tax=Arenimonas sp. TaxID=1872635 RepID=UPI002C4E987E|nr:OprO/OprP family phosphate-selective porin [Arenimonas sp.]HMB58123.1 OprO/OprP family phosphate-selective porin [Arenimonas sp.]
MKLLPNLLAVAVLAGLSAPAFAETEFDVIGGSEISFEGLLQADFNKYNADVAQLGSTGGTTAGDGIDYDQGMRRAELVFKGKGPGMWSWVVGYDARADKFLDVNVNYKFSGFTSLTVGQFKQPNSLEELSSTKNNDFIAKAMTTNLQGLSRRVGVGITTGGDNWTLTGSAFTRELTRNLTAGNGFGARIAWAPINETGNILHLGLSAVEFDARDGGNAVGTANFDRDGRARFRVRPDSDLTGTRLIDSGQFTDANKIRTLGAEAAWIHGPIKLQAEYMKSNISRDSNPDYGADSWYVSGVWNITGESWGWKTGTITTPLPNEPASGMWQLGLRYDKADLNDGNLVPVAGKPPQVVGVLGGKEDNITVGVNWYWRSNFKFSLNYVKVNSDRYITKTSATYSLDPALNSHTFNAVVDDSPNILELRAQLYW